MVPRVWRDAERHSLALSGRYLSFAEREEIALGRARGCGVREIARLTGRSPSTISRELRRNGATRQGRSSTARSSPSGTPSWARRPKTAKLADNDLRRYVEDRLAGVVQRPDGHGRGSHGAFKGKKMGRHQDRRWATAWSPEQISQRLVVDFPDDASMRISHEAIYQSLYIQGRGALRRELSACLRTGRALRVPRERVEGRARAS